MITNWRRGAGCQSMKLPTGLSRNAIWVVASPLVQAGVRPRSIGSTWDWPSEPVYSRNVFMVASLVPPCGMSARIISSAPTLSREGGPMRRLVGVLVVIALLLCLAPAGMAQSPAPAAAGQMTWAVHFTLAPRWLDPAESEGSITPFLTLYAVHDALLKPMPSGPIAPSLAESWTASPNGLVYDFVLRANARFHNGERVTAEDVKFSFERYHGANAAMLKERVQEVRVVDARRVQFHLKEPWADFITFYGTTATSAGWIVPRKYVERVGDEGFKKAPIGAGPYKVVS